MLYQRDEAGNKLEQRHFDAWGGLAAVAFGNNAAVITDKNGIANSSLLIDRGYTSHEHFAEVGVIHMNGRLYDPLLKRFLNADEIFRILPIHRIIISMLMSSIIP